MKGYRSGQSIRGLNSEQRATWHNPPFYRSVVDGKHWVRRPRKAGMCHVAHASKKELLVKFYLPGTNVQRAVTVAETVN